MTTAPDAIITKHRAIHGRHRYRLLVISQATSIEFATAQAAQDFIERYMPGKTIEWRLK